MTFCPTFATCLFRFVPLRFGAVDTGGLLMFNDGLPGLELVQRPPSAGFTSFCGSNTYTSSRLMSSHQHDVTESKAKKRHQWSTLVRTSAGSSLQESQVVQLTGMTFLVKSHDTRPQQETEPNTTLTPGQSWFILLMIFTQVN